MPRSSRTGKIIESQSWNKGGSWPGGKFSRPALSLSPWVHNITSKFTATAETQICSFHFQLLQSNGSDLTWHCMAVGLPFLVQRSSVGHIERIVMTTSTLAPWKIFIDISHFQSISIYTSIFLIFKLCRAPSSNLDPRVLIPLTSACKRVIETLGTILRLTLHSG